MFKVPEEFRVQNSKNKDMNTTRAAGNNGIFSIKKVVRKKYGMRDKHGNSKKQLSAKNFLLYLCIVSDAGGWEHVSVSLPLTPRTPTWDEMCGIKDLFWDKTDTVLQYHPAEEDYVNNHSTTLHLWRSTNQEIPKPPPEMAGIKSLGTLE